MRRAQARSFGLNVLGFPDFGLLVRGDTATHCDQVVSASNGSRVPSADLMQKSAMSIISS